MRALLRVLAVVALTHAGSAHAQMSAALGKPLPDAQLPAGSVTIRVVDGSPSKPLSGLTVELVAADGQNQAARTNPEGRASFKGLKPGSRFTGRVSVAGAQGAEPVQLSTEAFEVPEAGGLRFMLSAKPLSMEQSAPTAPRMDPRRASGIPRPQAGDPAGRLTVRALQGAMESGAAPERAVVHLIAYSADGGVSKTTKTLEQAQRVVFDGLSAGGRTVYYVLSLFERDGAVDRLASQPVTMLPRVGLRLLLAGHGADSGKEPVDDLVKREALPAAPAGQVLVRVGGREAERLKEVELVEVGRPDVVARGVLHPAKPSPDQVRGVAREPQTVATQEDALRVVVTQVVDKGPGRPVPGAIVRVLDVASEQVVAESVTGADGRMTVAELAKSAGKDGGSHRVEVEVHGKKLISRSFALAEAGGVTVAFDVAWIVSGLQAVFDGVQSGPDRVYLTRVKVGDQVFRSSPFQLTSTMGASVNMLIYSGLIFAFHGGGEIDDEHFWFQNQFTLYNPGNQPYLPPNGKVEIPLPAGFKNVQVGDEMASHVAPSKTGVVWRGPLPPGASSFIVTFAMPVEAGSIVYKMPLPMGAFRSQLVVRKTPGMMLFDSQGNAPIERERADGQTIKLLGGVPLSEGNDNQGRPLYVLSNLNIPANQSFVVTVKGLPVRAGWKAWVRYAVGLVVLVFIGWGLVGLWAGRHSTTADSASALGERRDQLLDEIVELEGGDGDNAERIERLKVELTALQRQLEAADANERRD